VKFTVSLDLNNHLKRVESGSEKYPKAVFALTTKSAILPKNGVLAIDIFTFFSFWSYDFLNFFNTALQQDARERNSNHFSL
jgi:hypothetical protein